MIAKLCRPMKAKRSGGGGGGGLVEYLIGYAIAEKGASAKEVRAALDGVFAEAAMRDDLGVGGEAGWSPVAGGGVRPSSIRVLNGCALEAIGAEMDADAAMCPGLAASTMHLVISLPTAEAGKSDAEMHQYVEALLAEVGLGGHRALVAIHRDTLVGERGPDGAMVYSDGNLHAHIAVGSVEPTTIAAFNRVGIHARLAWAARAVEMRFGLSHDRGLAVVRDQGSAEERIEWASPEERRMWLAEKKEERLAQSVGIVVGENESWEKIANVAVAPRCLAAMAEVPIAEDGEEKDAWRWSESHCAAARYGARLKVVDGEVAMVRESDGEVAKWEAATGEKAVGFLPALRAENIVLKTLAQSPGIVIDEIAKSQSTFFAGEIYGWLQRRITNPDDIERIATAAIHSEKVVLLAVDSSEPLYSTVETVERERQMVDDAAALAARPGIYAPAMENIIANSRLSEEQAEALRATTRTGFAVIEGAPGAGKTTIMRSLVEAAATDGRRVMGVTIAQAAARNLASEAGMEAVNAARLMAEERKGVAVVPQNGVLVVDEAGMVDSSTMRGLLHIAKTRDCAVVLVGDTAQLRPIAAGDAMAALRPIAAERAGFAEVKQIHRQKNAEHSQAIGLLRNAIAEADAVKREGLVVDAVRALDKAGMIVLHESRAAAMEASAQEIGAARASGKQGLLMDAGRDGTRLQNEALRRAAGIDGGIARRVDGGAIRHFAIGDEVKITRNGTLKTVAAQAAGRGADGGFVAMVDGRGVAIPTWSESAAAPKPQGGAEVAVVNGDEGRVIRADKRGIDVQISGGPTVHLPHAYRNVDHAYARTIHSAQGQTVDVASAVVDKGTSPEAALVAVSRARERGAIHASGYETADALARDIARKIEPMRTATADSIAEIVRQTGGKETMRVREIEKAAARLSTAERQEYNRLVVAPMRDRREAAIATAKKEYQSSAKSDDDLRAMRQKIAKAGQMSGPSPAAWARERAASARLRVPEISQEVPAQRRAMARNAELKREHKAYVVRAHGLETGRIATPNLLANSKISRLLRAGAVAERMLGPNSEFAKMRADGEKKWASARSAVGPMEKPMGPVVDASERRRSRR